MGNGSITITASVTADNTTVTAATRGATAKKQASAKFVLRVTFAQSLAHLLEHKICTDLWAVVPVDCKRTRAEWLFQEIKAVQV
jgi:hypothetical protein